MPSEIIWLPAAVKDLDRLRNFIKSENPRAAQRAAERMIEGVRILQKNPEVGIPVINLTDFRDLVLPFGSGEYIIRYRREVSDRIVIIRVRHSKEDGVQKS